MVYQADGMRLVILDGKLTTMAEIYQPADPQGRNTVTGRKAGILQSPPHAAWGRGIRATIETLAMPIGGQC